MQHSSVDGFGGRNYWKINLIMSCNTSSTREQRIRDDNFIFNVSKLRSFRAGIGYRRYRPMLLATTIYHLGLYVTHSATVDSVGRWVIVEVIRVTNHMCVCWIRNNRFAQASTVDVNLCCRQLCHTVAMPADTSKNRVSPKWTRTEEERVRMADGRREESTRKRWWENDFPVKITIKTLPS